MIDCNNCSHLSITEETQDYLKKAVGKSALYPHLCMKYNKRVYHWGDEPMIHPCPQCEEERRINYARRT